VDRRGADIPHQREWSRGSVDPSTTQRSRGSQLFGVQRRAYRTLSVRFAPAEHAAIAGNGLADGDDWEHIEAALGGARPCVAIARWTGEAAAYIQRTAIFGTASTQGDIEHQGGSWFDRICTFEEIPAAAA
jgi:hypothetical protein